MTSLVVSALSIGLSSSARAFWHGLRSAPALLLAAALLAGCGGGDDDAGVQPPPPAVAAPATTTYAIGGTVSGLAATGLVLQNNAGDDLALAADGAFRFATPLASGARYLVSVLAQPAGQVCAVVNDQGQANAPVSDVLVTCQSTAVPVPASAPADLAVSYAPKRYDFSWSPVAGASYYQLQEDPDGPGPAASAQIGANLGATEFKHAVALHLRLNASYTVRACNASGCGPSSAPLVPDLVKAIGYFKASNTGSPDEFGFSVALSADGATLAVGAFLEDSNATGIDGNQSDNSAPNAGAVYVYTRTNGSWAQQAYVKASNTGGGDQFGISVALSADGATLAVGAYREASSATGVNGNQSDNSAPNAGAVYVYSRTNGSWAQQAYVKASNSASSDYFGYNVALSADGATLAVGAYGEDSSATGINGDQADNSATDAGAVYVYTRTNGNWAQQAYVKASNTGSNDEFGYSVALSADGATLAVGAFLEDSNATGIDGNQSDNSAPNAGAVYVYTRTNGSWAQQAYVKASNTGGGDQFGASVALSADGAALAVGAYGEASSATGINGNQADNSAAGAGAVYVYSRTNGSWAQQAYVKASNTGSGDNFGFSLALSADGATLAVGAVGEGSNATGINGDPADNSAPSASAVYVYTRTNGSWGQQAYVKASNTGGGDFFGFSVALSADGATLAVGALLEDSSATGINGDQADNSASAAGAVYVY